MCAKQSVKFGVITFIFFVNFKLIIADLHSTNFNQGKSNRTDRFKQLLKLVVKLSRIKYILASALNFQ